MSIKVMSYVWEHSTHKGSELITLLAIADYADDAGIAYPSIAALARKARIKARNVQYVLTKLERSRELSIARNTGPKGCHIYTVALAGAAVARGGAKFAEGAKFAGCKDCTPEESPQSEATPDAKATPVGVQSLQGGQSLQGVQSLQGAIAIAPDPSFLKPKDLPPCLPTEDIPPLEKAASKRPGKPKAPTYPEGFLTFWNAYPHERRASKPTCLKVWHQQTLEPRTAEIVEKVERLKATSWLHKEPTYIPMTTTWLNQGRYEDDLMPIPRAVLTGGRVSPRTAQNAEISRRIIEEIESGRNGQSPIFHSTQLHG